MKTIVNVREGQLEGCLSADQKSVIFKGVPYAEPPVGALRWKRPQPKTPWEGVRPAKVFSAKAHQADLTREGFYAKEFYSDEKIERSEDCLYLNVWTPADAEPGDRLPVFFWIHGGAFLHGCGAEKEFDGEQFVKNGVVFVSINYRVGALGFFTHPELQAEDENGLCGNYGIYDQVAALDWCRENIAAFGGDPDNITVAGQSAGCMSVQILISSPLTKGKIRRAILQSGGGLGGLSHDYSLEMRTASSKKLMEALGASTLEEMRAIPAEKIAEVQYTIQSETGLAWLPVADGVLLADTVDAIARKGEAHDIDYMIGSTGNDIGADVQLLEKSAVRWSKNQLALNRTPAYVYFFNRKLPGDDAGAFHSSELWYEFHTLDRAWRPWEDCDWTLEAAVSGYWANFAKTGNPNGDGLPVWRPYTGEAPVRMLLAETIGEEPAISVED